MPVRRSGGMVGAGAVFACVVTVSVVLCGRTIAPPSPLSRARSSDASPAMSSAAGAPDSPEKPIRSDALILSRLLADYRAYGLPFPPDDADLITTRSSQGTYDGEERFSYGILFREAKGKQQTFWVGCEAIEPYSQPEGIEVVRQPTGESIEKSGFRIPQFPSEGFGTFPALALAVQFGARGWNEAGEALLVHSRRPSLRFGFDNDPPRPKDDRAALAMLAWNYWCNQFARTKGDRLPIVAYLRQLRDSNLGLDTAAGRNIIEDMQQTLADRQSVPGSLEEAIDTFTDVGLGGGWQGRGFADLESAVRRHAGCRRFRDAGLDGVPTLIRHLSDFRVTRCLGSSRRGMFHARFADVVAHLLNEFVTEEFSYDFLIREGRGKRLDPAHVLHWWTAARGTDALDFLRANAVVNDSQGRFVANGAMLHALGQSHPDELVRLFEENVGRVEEARALFETLGSSKASDQSKARLLLAAAGNSDVRKRELAIHQLLDSKHPQAVPLLVKELEAIPITPSTPYWLANAGRIAALVVRTDDERAWNTLERAAKRVDLGQRLEMLQAVGNCKMGDDRVIRLLSGFLGDTEVRTIHRGFPDPSKGSSPRDAMDAMARDPFSGPAAGFVWDRLAVRDFAALLLARQLGRDDRAKASWKDEDWAELRAETEQALAARKLSNDRSGAEK